MGVGKLGKLGDSKGFSAFLCNYVKYEWKM